MIGGQASSYGVPTLCNQLLPHLLADILQTLHSCYAIKVVALDNGVDPVRGAIATINITLSNTCLMDVLFDEIENEVLVNQTNGGVFFRIPRYYVREFGKSKMFSSLMCLYGDAFSCCNKLV